MRISNVLLATIGACVSSYAVSSRSGKIVVSKRGAYGHTTTLTGSGSAAGSLGEIVSYGVAGPTANAGRLLTAGGLGKLVVLTVEYVVTAGSVTEYKVIEHNAGVSSIGPTGELECLDLLRIKVSAVCICLRKISGVRTAVYTVDVVVGVHIAGVKHLDRDHNIEPLRPTVCYGNSCKVHRSVNTALDYYAGVKVILNNKELDEVVSPRTAIVPVRSISGLTNTESDAGILVCMSGNVSLHTEGNYTYSVVLAREAGKNVIISIRGRHPRLELTAGNAGSRVPIAFSNGIEDEAPCAVLVVNGINLTVRSVSEVRIFAVTVPLAVILQGVGSAASASESHYTVSLGYLEVVGVSSVTECKVIKLVACTCCGVIRVKIYAVDGVRVDGKCLNIGIYVLAVNVVVNGKSIGIGVKNKSDNNVYPTAIVVLVNIEGSKNIIIALELNLAVFGRIDGEYVTGDSPKLAPTDSLGSLVNNTVTVYVNVIGSVINKLHSNHRVGVSVDAEGEVTFCTVCRREACKHISTACGGKPKLKLSSCSVSCALNVGLSYKLKIIACKNRKPVVVGISGVISSVVGSVCRDTIVVGTIGIVTNLNLVGVFAKLTGIGVGCAVVNKSVSYGISLTLGVITSGASLTCLTGSCAEVVAKSCDLNISGVIATRTGLVCIPTSVGAIGSLSCVVNIIVIKSCVNNLGSGDKLVTYGAVNCIVVATSLGTSRKNYFLSNCLGCSVTECIDNSLTDDLATNSTLLCSGKTGCSTSGCLTLYGLGGRMLTSKVCATSITKFVAVLVGVSERIDGYLSESGNTTNGALSTVGETILGTGCCVTGNNLFGVAKSLINNKSSGNFSATYCTVNNLFVAACLSTVRKNYVLLNNFAVGVAKSLTVNLAAKLTVLSIGTGSIYPCVLVTVEVPVAIGSVTEYEVIHYITGAELISPTVDVNCLNLVVIKGILAFAGVSKISGVCVVEFTVDIVGNGEGVVILKLDEHLNVDPLGPAVLINSNRGEVCACIDTTANVDRTVSTLGAAYGKKVDRAGSPTGPVSSIISGLTNCNGEGTKRVGLNAEGDNAECVLLAREVLEDKLVVIS